MYLVTETKRKEKEGVVYEEIISFVAYVDQFRAEVVTLALNKKHGENGGARYQPLFVGDAKCTKALPIEVCKSEGHEGITQIKYFELAEDRYLAVTLRPDPLTNEPTLSQTAYIHEGFETTVFTPSEWVKNVINEKLGL